ncbi:MAG: ABC transporter permease [Flavisolibacter sp.]|nr:ABC transporter permease [Flavisolibacter sp.]MBD0352736.1 ABC transporter permease [Flavisolibacter sp.]
MNFLFAWRYFKAKKTTNAINIIAWISIVAIIIGTASLILVLSVFNGFEGLVKSLYSSFYPDLRISPATGKEMVLTKEQIAKLQSLKGIHAVALVVEEKALLINGDYQVNAYVKGVDDQYNRVSGVKDHIIRGAFDIGDKENPKLVLGDGIENAIGVQSDRNLAPVTLYTGRKGSIDLQNPLNSVSSGLANTAGTFRIQQDFDNRYVLTNIDFIKELLGMAEDNYSSAEIALQAGTDPGVLKNIVEQTLGNLYTVQTRYQQNASLYGVMRLEKWVIYAILSLILIVAAFNMIGALTMLVLEKKNDISVLHALGGDKAFIQKIFLSEGLLLALIGGGTGMFLALTIALLQIHYKLIPLQGGSFLIDYFPVQLSVGDFLLVGATILVIALLASWIPARKAANQQFLLREE